MYLDDELIDDAVVRRLRAGMTTETVALQSDPGLAQSVRRRHRNRQLARGGFAATPALAAAAVVATTMLHAGAAPPPAAGRAGSGSIAGAASAVAGAGVTTATRAIGVTRLALVMAQTQQALAQVDDYVIDYRAAVSSGPGAVEIMRRDPLTKRQSGALETSDGKRLSASVDVPQVDGGRIGLLIDDVARTYQRLGRSGPSPTASCSPDQSCSTGPIEPKQRAIDALTSDDPAAISAALQAGQVQLVGDETLDGVAVVHLRVVVTYQENATPARFGVDLWVDAARYLPVRRAYDKAGFRSAVDIVWLPRTAENLASFDLTPPAGYREVFVAPDAPPSPGTGVG